MPHIKLVPAQNGCGGLYNFRTGIITPISKTIFSLIEAILSNDRKQSTHSRYTRMENILFNNKFIYRVTDFPNMGQVTNSYEIPFQIRRLEIDLTRGLLFNSIDFVLKNATIALLIVVVNDLTEDLYNDLKLLDRSKTRTVHVHVKRESTVSKVLPGHLSLALDRLIIFSSKENSVFGLVYHTPLIREDLYSIDPVNELATYQVFYMSEVKDPAIYKCVHVSWNGTLRSTAKSNKILSNLNQVIDENWLKSLLSKIRDTPSKHSNDICSRCLYRYSCEYPMINENVDISNDPKVKPDCGMHSF